MKHVIWMVLRGWAVILLSGQAIAETEQSVEGDFHRTIYIGQQGVISDIELFTKQPDKEVFFGVTCSAMSPFPLLQVLLFNGAVLSETPKFLSVAYRIDGESIEHKPGLQGILNVVDSADEFSNKVRLELELGQIRSMNVMNKGYQTLLSDLKQGRKVVFSLHSRSFDSQNYEFSLEGLKALLEPYESVCR